MIVVKHDVLGYIIIAMNITTLICSLAFVKAVFSSMRSSGVGSPGMHVQNTHQEIWRPTSKFMHLYRELLRDIKNGKVVIYQSDNPKLCPMLSHGVKCIGFEECPFAHSQQRQNRRPNTFSRHRKINFDHRYSFDYRQEVIIDAGLESHAPRVQPPIPRANYRPPSNPRNAADLTHEPASLLDPEGGTWPPPSFENQLVPDPRDPEVTEEQWKCIEMLPCHIRTVGRMRFAKGKETSNSVSP